jgi:hypothetical protein
MRRSWNEWSAADESYHDSRRGVMESVDLRDYADHPTVFASRQALTGLLSRLRMFEMILDVPGAVVECGVYRGAGLMLYYHLSSILEPFAFNRKIYGFDSFSGLRSLSRNDPPNLKEEMFSDADPEVLERMIAVSDGNRPVPQIPKCEIIRGDAVATIPEFVRKHPELIIALLYLDFDVYEPTRAALEHLLPLVPKGGIVAFDELNAARWAGETVALKEKLRLPDVALRRFPFDPWPAYFVVGS